MPTEHSGDEQPTYRHTSTAVRALGLLVVMLLVAVMILPPIIQRLIAPGQPTHVEVVVDNRADVPYVVWGSTDPRPLPSGDEYLLARFGFQIGPHSVAALPSDRAWTVVEVWTQNCELITEDAAPAVSGRVVIRADQTVTTIEGDIEQHQLEARPTDACALQQYVPASLPDGE